MLSLATDLQDNAIIVFFLGVFLMVFGFRYICAGWFSKPKALILTINARIAAWLFLVKGPSLIEDAYKKIFPLRWIKNHYYWQYLTGKWETFPRWCSRESLSFCFYLGPYPRNQCCPHNIHGMLLIIVRSTRFWQDQTACFVLHDFCLRLEYIPLIRQEVESVGWESFDTSKGQGFPLLDSFMKESSRLNPVEASKNMLRLFSNLKIWLDQIVSTRRVALKPFELSGGHQVPVGEWVCTAPGAMHHDSAYYAKSSEFHGFRFVEPSLYRNILEATNFEIPELGKSSEFVSVPDWQLWGTGRIAWWVIIYPSYIYMESWACKLIRW